jgi:cytochrome c-type biogenesis protein CcmH
MLLWIVFAVLTALVIIVLVAPLYARKSASSADRADFDLVVYKDQLAELDRDMAAGIIGQVEADAARNEVSRRILSARDEKSAAEASTGASTPAWLWFSTIAAIPAITLVIYMNVGRPELPAQPLDARLQTAAANQDMVAMVRQVEKHLETDPSDAKGWSVLGPIYSRMGRHAEAANAYRQVLRLTGPNAEVLADLGETMVVAREGLVDADAVKIFEAATDVDAANMKARFFLALAKSQEGNAAEARTRWQSMLVEGPVDAPWRPVVERELAKLSGETPSVLPELPSAPALSAEQMQAGQQMSQSERTTMIRGMVEGLDQRLAEDGTDLDGWLRLIRARMVLGEKDKAADALNRAKAAFSADERAKAALDETGKALGL